MISPRPWQVGQVRSMVKKPWLARTLPCPPQVAQVLGLLPALAPVPEHVSQETLDGTRIWAVLPVKASFKRDLEIVAQVGAALAARAAALSAAAAGPPRRPPMNSPNRSSKMSDMEDAKSGPKPPGRRGAAHAAFERGMAELVVGRALLGVLQGLVGLVDLLEFLFGRLVAGVAVGVEFLGELAIGGLQVLLAGAARHAQCLVVIALGHVKPASFSWGWAALWGAAHRPL